MITFTDPAINKLFETVEAEGLLGTVHVRLKVKGGGCAGFSYEIGFDEPLEIDETIIETTRGGITVKVICDPVSNQYLEGTIVDHERRLMQEGFVFRNPNVTATCGCGNSFAV